MDKYTGLTIGFKIQERLENHIYKNLIHDADAGFLWGLLGCYVWDYLRMGKVLLRYEM